MQPYNISASYEKKKEIFDAISQPHKYSPSSVIDIIKDHPAMHFGSKNLNVDFIELILWALTDDNENVARYIYKEFQHEMQNGSLLYRCIMQDADSIFVDDLFDDWDIKDKGAKSPTSIILQVLKNVNNDYFESLINHRKAIESLGAGSLSNMFFTFTKQLMADDLVVKRWKRILIEFSKVNETMMEISVEDTELIDRFYPNAADIFFI